MSAEFSTENLDKLEAHVHTLANSWIQADKAAYLRLIAQVRRANALETEKAELEGKIAAAVGFIREVVADSHFDWGNASRPELLHDGYQLLDNLSPAAQAYTERVKAEGAKEDRERIINSLDALEVMAGAEEGICVAIDFIKALQAESEAAE